MVGRRRLVPPYFEQADGPGRRSRTDRLENFRLQSLLTVVSLVAASLALECRLYVGADPLTVTVSLFLQPHAKRAGLPNIERAAMRL